jgi:flagellar hook-basal body complex protein FliE
MSIESIGGIGSPLSSLQSIRPNDGLALPLPGTPGIADSPTTSKTFGQHLQDAIADVNAAQLHSADLTKRFAAGEPLDVHQVMIASQEAGTMLELAVNVRNKIVEAYQEVMRVSM